MRKEKALDRCVCCCCLVLEVEEVLRVTIILLLRCVLDIYSSIVCESSRLLGYGDGGEIYLGFYSLLGKE